MCLSGIGIAALVILILIVAIILIVLLTPITYSIDVIGRSPYKGEVKVNWLWRVLSVHFAYMQDRPLFKQVYVLGRQKIGPIRDYDEWLAKRVEEEFQKTVSDDDLEDPILNSTVFKSEPKKTKSVDMSATATEASSDGTTEENRTFVERVTFTKDWVVKEKIYRTEPVSDTIGGTTSDSANDSASESTGTTTADSGEKEFVSEITKFWWTKHVLNTDLWEQVLLVGKRSYDHSKPRDMFIEGKFGLGNPHRTGLLAAMIYTIWPEKVDDIELDYMSFHGEGSGYIKGRIILGVLAWYGTKFVLSRPMRELISETIHVLWVKRKEQKLIDKGIVKKQEDAPKEANATAGTQS